MINLITGKTHDNNFFQFYENNKVDLEKFLEVLEGKTAGCVFRKAISEKDCKNVEENFWKSPFLKQRNDDVPAYFLGPYHYGKELDLYLQEAEDFKESLESLFNGGINFFKDFIFELSSFLENKKITLRLAEHLGKKASAFRLLSWPKSANYSLQPHDDLAQCMAEIQKDFEIQKVKDFQVIAVNICIQNSEVDKGGRLHYWNIQPDDNARKSLGIEKTGYPYPEKLLKGTTKKVLTVSRGDIYCFNGRNIHAVDTTIKDNNRLILSFFIGFINKNTILYWV